MSQTAVDEGWMQQAIALSRSALYVTSPNPRVGCVIVKNGRCIASGVTQQAGGPHAEVVALQQARQAGIDVNGATLYVTLEPCSHHGRTPPCADAIIAAGIGRVVAALRDPNPLVAGRGLLRLQQAGIDVSHGVCDLEALEVNPGFFSRMLWGRPWVWLKSAVSLDGRVALPNGQSQWITGSRARDDGHHWRARSCVVLTGIGTVLDDDPQMTVRAIETPRQPVRAVVDSQLRLPESARIIDGNPILVFTLVDDSVKTQRLAQRNVRVVHMPERHGKVDLLAMIQWLGQHDFNEIHVEAGAGLSGALYQQGLIDEMVVYMAPVLLGDGMPMAAMPALSALSEAKRYAFVECTPIASDIRLRLRNPSRWQALCDAMTGQRQD